MTTGHISNASVQLYVSHVNSASETPLWKLLSCADAEAMLRIFLTPLSSVVLLQVLRWSRNAVPP